MTFKYIIDPELRGSSILRKAMAAWVAAKIFANLSAFQLALIWNEPTQQPHQELTPEGRKKAPEGRMTMIRELLPQLNAVNARWVAQSKRTKEAYDIMCKHGSTANREAFDREDEAKKQLDGERHQLLLQASPIARLLIGGRSCLTLLTQAKGVEDGWLFGLPGAGKQKVKGDDIEDLELALDALRSLDSVAIVEALEAAFFAALGGLPVLEILRKAWRDAALQPFQPAGGEPS